MVIAQDLLDVLRCPHCVRANTGRAGNDPGQLEAVRNDTWLVCQEPDCSYKYPVEDGIPVMLIVEGAKWASVHAEDLPDPDKMGDDSGNNRYERQPEYGGSKNALLRDDEEQVAISGDALRDPKTQTHELDPRRVSFLARQAEQLMEALWARHEEQIPSDEEMFRCPEFRHEFDQQRFPVLQRLADQLITEVSPCSAVDVGIGLGIISAKLKAAGVQVTSLDLNKEYLLSIRQKERHANLVQGDCTHLPFADASFDLVVATDIIEHVPLYEQALCGCGRVARRGILFSTSLNGLHRTLAQFIGYDVRAWDESIGHLHVYSYSKLMRLLSANLEGFQLSRPDCLFVTPFYLSILTLNYRLPAAWTRPLLRIPNWLATRFPAVLGNWIALCATRHRTRALDNKAGSGQT